jgi:hypothetical protein
MVCSCQHKKNKGTNRKRKVTRKTITRRPRVRGGFSVTDTLKKGFNTVNELANGKHIDKVNNVLSWVNLANDLTGKPLGNSTNFKINNNQGIRWI